MLEKLNRIGRGYERQERGRYRSTPRKTFCRGTPPAEIGS